MAREDLDTDTLEKTEEPSLRDALEAAFDDPSADEPDAGDLDTGTDEAGQPRDEQGRWTKAQREHYDRQREIRETLDLPEDAQPEPGEAELVMAPPPGWNPSAKAAFAKLPPEVQEAVARREQEVNQGFVKLRDFKGLEPFAEMAKASGTTLTEAFQRYKAAEDHLDQDFRGGVLQLCEMYGVHPMQLANEFASMFTGQRGQAPQQPGQPTDPNVGLLARELAGIKEFVRTLSTEREQHEKEAINGTLSQFAQEKLYFEDVRRDMAQLIRTGQANDLEEAYDKACWMNPQIRDLLIKEQAAPQNAAARVSAARRASGSLQTGAPAGSVSSSTPNSIRSALEDAWGQTAV